MQLCVNIDIESSKSKVWAAITDIKHCDKMISGITKLNIIEQPEEGLIGLKWTETRLMFGKEAAETMWITDCKEQVYYYTRAENSGAIYVTKMSVLEVGNTTRLTMLFTASSDSFFVRIISSIMSLFIKTYMVKMLKRDLEDIKSFVEKN